MRDRIFPNLSDAFHDLNRKNKGRYFSENQFNQIILG